MSDADVRTSAVAAERISLSGSAGFHVVIYDRQGTAIEVRLYQPKPGQKPGPVGLGDEWWTRGRLTWRDGAPLTITARCAINTAARQIEARAQIRKDEAAERSREELANSPSTGVPR